MMQPQSPLLRYILIAILLIEATSCSSPDPKWGPGQEKNLDEYTAPTDRISAIVLPQGKKRVLPPQRSKSVSYQTESDLPEYLDEEYSDKLDMFDQLDTNIQIGRDARYLHNLLARKQPAQAREIMLTLPDNPTKEDIKKLYENLENALGGVKKSGFLYGFRKTPIRKAGNAQKHLKEIHDENQRLYNKLALKGYAVGLAQVRLKMFKEKGDTEMINFHERLLKDIFETDTLLARFTFAYLHEKNVLNIFINNSLFANNNEGFDVVEKQHQYGARWREWSERDALIARQCDKLRNEIYILLWSSEQLNVEEKNDSLLPGGYYFTEIKKLEKAQEKLEKDLKALYNDMKQLTL